MRQISEGIYGLLVSQGIEAGRAGNTGRHGMKGPGAASDGARGGVAAGEDSADLNSGKGTPAETGAKSNREVSANAQEPSPSREAARPVLRLIVSNKYLDVASPTRMPRAATSRYLVLV